MTLQPRKKKSFISLIDIFSSSPSPSPSPASISSSSNTKPVSRPKLSSDLHMSNKHPRLLDFRGCDDNNKCNDPTVSTKIKSQKTVPISKSVQNGPSSLSSNLNAGGVLKSSLGMANTKNRKASKSISKSTGDCVNSRNGCHNSNFADSNDIHYFSLVEPLPTEPPPYSTTLPGSPKPVFDDLLPKAEVLPFYTPTIYKLALLSRKMEWVSPYEMSSQRNWKMYIVELNSTQLNLYPCPFKNDDPILKKLETQSSYSNSNSSSLLHPYHHHHLYLRRNNNNLSDTSKTDKYNEDNYKSNLTTKTDLRALKFFKESGLLESNKIVRSYSLQYGKIGLAIDYKKKRYVLRIRFEAEQFLFEFPSPESMIEWYISITLAIDNSLDLSRREMPKYRTVPRRRRRRRNKANHNNLLLNTCKKHHSLENIFRRHSSSSSSGDIGNIMSKLKLKLGSKHEKPGANNSTVSAKLSSEFSKLDENINFDNGHSNFSSIDNGGYDNGGVEDDEIIEDEDEDEDSDLDANLSHLVEAEEEEEEDDEQLGDIDEDDDDLDDEAEAEPTQLLVSAVSSKIVDDEVNVLPIDKLVIGKSSLPRSSLFSVLADNNITCLQSGKISNKAARLPRLSTSSNSTTSNCSTVLANQSTPNTSTENCSKIWDLNLLEYEHYLEKYRPFIELHGYPTQRKIIRDSLRCMTTLVSNEKWSGKWLVIDKIENYVPQSQAEVVNHHQCLKVITHLNHVGNSYVHHFQRSLQEFVVTPSGLIPRINTGVESRDL